MKIPPDQPSNAVRLNPGEMPPSSQRTAALLGSTFGALAAGAPTPGSMNVSGTTPMTQAQQNTFWMTRAASDFAILALDNPPLGTPSITQNALNELSTIENLTASSAPDLSSLIGSLLAKYNDGQAGDFDNLWGSSQGGGIFANWILGQSSSSEFDMTDVPLDNIANIYTFMIASVGLLGPSSKGKEVEWGPQIQSFWNSATSGPAINFSQTMYTYFEEQSMNPDGSINVGNMQTNMLNLYTIADSAAQNAGFKNLIDPKLANSNIPGFFSAFFGGSVGNTSWPGFFGTGGVQSQGTPWTSFFQDQDGPNSDATWQAVFNNNNNPSLANQDPLPPPVYGSTPLSSNPTLSFSPPTPYYTNIFQTIWFSILNGL